MLNSVHNFIYLLGLQSVRYGKKFFRKLGALLLRPVKAAGTLVFTAAIVIDKLLLRTFHEYSTDIKELAMRAKRAAQITSDSNLKKSERFKVHVRKAWEEYRHVFAYVGNYVMPVIALVILVNVINVWKSQNYALEINYNNKVIGFVQNESVYKQAREQALNRLDISTVSNDKDGSDSQIIGNVEYSLKTVKLSEINDSSTICDNLIENSNTSITNACGIYIDDDFLCAIKNETDAVAVFDNYLADYDTGEANATVGFVENIEYMQGLYPDNNDTIWDASELGDALKGKKNDAVYYTVAAGDTVSQIAQKFGLSSSDVFSLNPALRESIYVGQKVLIQKQVNLVQVKVTKTETRTVSVPYKTIKVNNSSLYVGDSKVTVKGVNGSQKVTELVTYVDGVRVSTKEIARETITEPVDEQVQVGTKAAPYRSRYSGYGYSSSTRYYNTYSGGRLAWPGVGATVVSSRYGRRSLNGWHNGIDLTRPGGSYGAPVVAAASGRVVSTSYQSMGGYVILIDHGNGMQTLYAHLKPGSILVRPGQSVSRGQQIASIGATGFVTGPHLHFEVRINGSRVNPAPYIGA